MDNTAVIKSALQWLLLQPKDNNPFVVIEDSQSAKYVQFMGSNCDLLMLDLPWQTLSEVEFYRAVSYLKQWGVAGEEYQVFDAPGGMPVGEQFSFQTTFLSVDAAATMAMGVFERVYELPQDCTLCVTKDWQG